MQQTSVYKVQIVSLLLTIVLLSSVSAYGQRDTSFVYIVARATNWDDTLTSFSLKHAHDFVSHREYIADTIFRDSQLLCNAHSLNCSVTFSLSGTQWLIHLNDTFYNFYPFTDSIPYWDSTLGAYADYVLIKSKYAKDTSLLCYQIHYRSIGTSTDTYLWFSPQIGIVAITNNQLALVRRGYLLEQVLIRQQQSPD